MYVQGRSGLTYLGAEYRVLKSLKCNTLSVTATLSDKRHDACVNDVELYMTIFFFGEHARVGMKRPLLSSRQ
jgi:hypothetical protein